MIHDNVWTTYSSEDLRKVNGFSRDYIDFLNNGKTERECIDLLVVGVHRKPGLTGGEACVR